MGHAGHFVCGPRCQFHLTTYVGGYIVSTLGELPANKFSIEAGIDINGFEDLGRGYLYETMVFKARKSKRICCPYEMENPSEVDGERYTNADEATLGHMLMCEKWSRVDDAS